MALVFDVESTDLDETAEILQLCVWEIVSSPNGPIHTPEPAINTKVKVNVEINPEAEAIHGISNDDLKDAPSFPEVWDEFYELIQRCAESSPNTPLPLISYNSTFDYRLLRQSAASNEIDIDLDDVIELCAMRSVAESLFSPDHRHETKLYKCSVAHALLVSGPNNEPVWPDSAWHDASADVRATCEILCSKTFYDLQNAPWIDHIAPYTHFAGVLGRSIGENLVSSLLKTVAGSQYINECTEEIDRLDCEIPVRALDLYRLQNLNGKLKPIGLFWAAWREHKELVKCLGFRAAKTEYGRWSVQLLLHPPEIDDRPPNELIEDISNWYHD